MRTRAALILLGLIATFLSPITASAVIANPTPDCSAGSTCTITFSTTGDYYQWTVPSGITSLTMDVIGASGGTGGATAAGKGARMTGVLTVTSGSVIKIYVGQQGTSGSGGQGGGGGGGSFVVASNNSALIVAGGGCGGAGSCCGTPGIGQDATTSTSGTAGNNPGGTSGAGGTSGGGGGSTSFQSSGGGGGFVSDGVDGAIVGNRGRSFPNGLAGGSGTFSGGYGGGGGSRFGAGGGGGGYSGGGASGGGDSWGAGGGGGSYSIATSQGNTSGFRTGNGQVLVTYLNSPIVTTVSLSLAGGITQVPKGRNIVITATVDQAGRISFFADGKRIPRCYNKAVSGSTKTCTWKPSIQKQVTLTSRLNPTNIAYSNATTSMKVWVVRRTGTR